MALLSGELAEDWRSGESAAELRSRMRNLDLTAGEVELQSAEAFRVFAPQPCSVVMVKEFAGPPTAFVSLLGEFRVGIPLSDDLQGVDLAWLSDPLDPNRSRFGSLARLVAAADRA